MSSWIKRTALAAVASFALMHAASAEVVYNRANSGEPETLDTHKTSTVQESHILRDMLEGLVTYNAKGQAVPGQAEKWEISDDGKLYRFTLRSDLKWSNGDPVKASDFVFSYRRIMNPETGAKYANILYPILNGEKVHKGQAKPEELGVKAVDDRILEIRLEQSTPYFLELLTHQTSLPVHPGSVEKFGKDFVKPGNMVSNGAYKLAEFVPNSHIKLVKNQNYYAAKVSRSTTVMYYPTSDFAAMVRRYEAGELDSTDDLPADQIKSLKQRFGNQVQLGPWLGTWYMPCEYIQSSVQRRSRPPGSVDDGRSRVHCRADLGRDDAARVLVHAAGHRQLRRAGRWIIKTCRRSTAKRRPRRS